MYVSGHDCVSVSLQTRLHNIAVGFNYHSNELSTEDKITLHTVEGYLEFKVNISMLDDISSVWGQAMGQGKKRKGKNRNKREMRERREREGGR